MKEIPQDLLLLSDQTSGAIALCHQEQYISKKIVQQEIEEEKSEADAQDQQEVNKFIIKVQPRVLLVPTIDEQDSGPLVAHCMIPCPAEKVLCSSKYWLCTLHADGRVRLWNTDDGRCVVSSVKGQFGAKPIGMLHIDGKQFPGFIAVVIEESQIYIVNAYTMSVMNHLFLDFVGLTKMVYNAYSSQLILCDGNGKVLVLKDQNGQKNATHSLQSMYAGPYCEPANQKSWINYLNKKQPLIQLRFQVVSQFGGKQQFDFRRSVKFQQALTFHYINDVECIVVSQDQINQYKTKESCVIKEFEDEERLLFAKFITLPEKNIGNINSSERQSSARKSTSSAVIKEEKVILVCVDLGFNLTVYRLENLMEQKYPTEEQKQQLRVSMVEPVLSQLPMFKKAKVFDFQEKAKTQISLLSDYCSAQEEKESFAQKMEACMRKMQVKIENELLQKDKAAPKLFRFSKSSNTIYAIVEQKSSNIFQPNENSTLQLSWDLAGIIEMLKNDQSSNINIPSFQLPLCVTPLDNILSGVSPSNSGGRQSPNTADFNCPVNLNRLLLTNFYNKLNFQFFYTDETVTQSICTIDNQMPVYIIGTSYGRVFILQMFHEASQGSSSSQQSKPPVAILDCHHTSPITKLYVAYQASRANRNQGCHLMAASADGTLSVTDLSQRSLNAQIELALNKGKHQRPLDKVEWKRLDRFLEQRADNQKRQRRHSFSGDAPSTKKYFMCTRIKPDARFEYACCSSQIESIQVVRSFDEIQAWGLKGAPSSATISKQHFYYALITEKPGELAIVQIGNERRAGAKSGLEIDLFKIHGIKDKVLTVLEDTTMHTLQCITDQKLSMVTFNLRSKSLSAPSRARPFSQTIQQLKLTAIIDKVIEENKYYLQVMHSEDLNLMDFESYDKHVQWSGNGTLKILRGNGGHQVLEYLNSSVNMPIMYSPGPNLCATYTKSLRDLLQHKKDILQFHESEDSQQKVLRAFIQIFNHDNMQRLQSDSTHDFFSKHAGVVNMQSQGKTFCNSRQQILMASGKHMVPILVSQQILSKQKKPDQQQNFRSDSTGLDFGEERKSQKASSPMDNKENAFSWSHDFKMPMKLLGLTHPFSLNEPLDETLESVCNLSWPLLDFRIGVQGADTAFSFILSKEDQDFYLARENVSKTMALLNMSKQIKDFADKNPQIKEPTQDVLEKVVNPGDCSIYLGRFLNSDIWKVSPYLTSVISSFCLSILMALLEVDSKNDDMRFLCEEWLDSLHIINYASKFRPSPGCPLMCPKPLSISYLSSLLLSEDRIITTCAQDMLIKPLLRAGISSVDYAVFQEVSDWQDLVLETYAQLKTQAELVSGNTSKQQQQQQSQQSEGVKKISQFDDKTSDTQGIDELFNFEVIKSKRESMAFDRMTFKDQLAVSQSSTDKRVTEISQEDVKRQKFKQRLSHYFGDMEVRGLINVSLYEFYTNTEDTSQHVQKDNLERVSKMNVTLTNEIISSFKNTTDFVSLLTALSQNNLQNIKTSEKLFLDKQITKELTNQLLVAHTFYPSALKDGQFLTRTQARNFFLTCPTNQRLFLKLKLTKALFELGTAETDQFLTLIQREATSLEKGTEYQQNVLEILRQFIIEFSSKLERHVIQLVQILLRCLDPNDMSLRKNSHQEVQQILSSLVRTFPMIAFHPKSQRLAVGTHDGPIGIYDVRTSAKWRILEGHSGNVTSVCFDSKGEALASYSAVDLTLRTWKTGNSGFFSTIINGTGQQVKQYKLPPLGTHVASPHMSNNEIQFGRMTKIGAEGSKPERPAVRCKVAFIPPKEKEVELIREDGKVGKFNAH